MAWFLLMSLALGQATAGKSIQLEVPIPNEGWLWKDEEMVPAVQRMAIAPSFSGWSASCADDIAAGLDQRIREIQEDHAWNSVQRVVYEPRFIHGESVSRAQRETRVRAVESDDEARKLGAALGVDAVAWGQPSKRAAETDWYFLGFHWSVTDVVTGERLAYVSMAGKNDYTASWDRLYPNFAARKWHRTRLNEACPLFGARLAQRLFPIMEAQRYSLVKDDRHKDHFALFTRERFDELLVSLKELERADPADPAVQFNLGVLEEIRGNLDGAEVYYGRAEDGGLALPRSAVQRFERRKAQVARLAAGGFRIMGPSFGGPRIVDLQPGEAPAATTILQVSSEPLGGTVFIGADDFGPTPVEIRGLAEGAALVTLVLEDHAPGTATANLIAGEVVEQKIVLAKDTGSIRVSARPGSTVETAGQAIVVGDSGHVLFDSVGVGDHTVSISLVDHVPEEHTVSVVSGRTAELRSRQAMVPGILRVIVYPSTASVFVDERRVGESGGVDNNFTGEGARMQASVTPGLHWVKVSAPDHEPSRQRVELDPGQELRLEVRLEPTTSDFTMVIEPEGSTVMVDGEEHQADHKLLLEGLAAGEHSFEVSHPDYFPWVKVLRVTGESRQLEHVELRPKPGRVLVVSQPLQAEVWLNGSKVGVTPFSGELPVGEVRFVVKKDGYVDGEREMDILPNRDHRVNVTLEAQ
jgi:hypothetical protein